MRKRIVASLLDDTVILGSQVCISNVLCLIVFHFENMCNFFFLRMIFLFTVFSIALSLKFSVA